MATDPRLAAALQLAQREAAAGALSPEAARQLLAAVTGDPEAIPELKRSPRRRPHDDRLRERDDVVMLLCDLLPDSYGATWRKAGRISDWLHRWHSGDDLGDAPYGADDLCQQTPRALSHHQVYRILCGRRGD